MYKLEPVIADGGRVIIYAPHIKEISPTHEQWIRRVDVILATTAPEETRAQINLGCQDPSTVDVQTFENREDEGILVVPDAGEMLFRLSAPANPSFILTWDN